MSSDELESLRKIRDDTLEIPDFLRNELNLDIERREAETSKKVDDMPYSEEQNKLFRAAEHNPDIARRHGLTQQKAGELASEGVKKDGAACDESLPKKAIRVRWKKLIK